MMIGVFVSAQSYGDNSLQDNHYTKGKQLDVAWTLNLDVNPYSLLYLTLTFEQIEMIKKLSQVSNNQTQHASLYGRKCKCGETSSRNIEPAPIPPPRPFPWVPSETHIKIKKSPQ